MLNRAGDLLHPPRHVKEVHLIVPFSHLIRHTARPRLDLVKSESLLVIPRLADVDVFVRGESPGPALVEPCHKHDEAPVEDIFDLVVAVLPRLDHLVLKEVFLEAVHRLLGSVVPARVNPFLTSAILPGSIDLRHDGLGEVIRIPDVNPIP